MDGMDRERLARIGRVIFGSNWQTALAIEMGVNPRTVRGWVSGRSSVPEDVPEVYYRLLHEKIAHASAALHEVSIAA
jgi:hypothetical protein